MGHRKSILSSHGYQVRYEERPKERDCPASKHCIAIKGSVKYFAFTICHPANPDTYQRIQSVQDSIPHMARMVEPIEDIVLLEEASGEKIGRWTMRLTMPS